ncbi:hypothetical protein GCM10022221_82320 [Actinocorallia aurea]
MRHTRRENTDTRRGTQVRDANGMLRGTGAKREKRNAGRAQGAGPRARSPVCRVRLIQVRCHVGASDGNDPGVQGAGSRPDAGRAERRGGAQGAGAGGGSRAGAGCGTRSPGRGTRVDAKLTAQSPGLGALSEGRASVEA